MVGEITKDNDPFLSKVSGHLTAEGRERSRTIPQETFLLTNSGATLGVPKITLLEGCINDGSVAILEIPFTRKLFLYYFLRSRTDALRQINQGVGQPNLNTELVKNIVVPSPPLEEQDEIVRRVEALFKLADAIEKRVTAATLQVKKLTQAILGKAFRGELVQTEAELARREGRKYEPASVVLERIKAEKAKASDRLPAKRGTDVKQRKAVTVS